MDKDAKVKTRVSEWTKLIMALRRADMANERCSCGHDDVYNAASVVNGPRDGACYGNGGKKCECQKFSPIGREVAQ